MPRSRNIDVKDKYVHIGIRTTRDKKQEYETYLKSFTDLKGQPRFTKLSTFIKWLVDGFTEGTIVEVKSKEEMNKSGIQIRKIIKEEMDGLSLTFKNMIYDISGQFKDYRDYDLECKVIVELEKSSLSSESLSEKLNVNELELLRTLNRLVDTKHLKINENEKYEVIY